MRLFLLEQTGAHLRRKPAFRRPAGAAQAKRATDRVRLGLAAAKRSGAEIQFSVTQVENRLLPEPILTNAIQIKFACAAIRALSGPVQSGPISGNLLCLRAYSGRAATPTFFGNHAGRRSVCLEVCCIDYYGLILAVFRNRPDHHPSEDVLLAPTLPASVKRRVRAIDCRGSRHLNPLRLLKIIPLRTRLSSTRGIPRDFGKKG